MSQSEKPPFPWDSDERFAACNFALGDLFNNLPSLALFEQRLHLPTLLCAAGAIAGFSAQRALFAEQGAWPAGTQVATTKAGQTFYFGDPLNHMLVPASCADAPLRLWPVVAGAVQAAGVAPPDLNAMFAHVSRTIGQDADFFPTPADAQPRMGGLALLRHAWPFARNCFEGELSGKVMRDEGIVPQRWRPVVAAYVAHFGLRQSQATLDPVIGATLLMESAIYASKVDPTLIET